MILYCRMVTARSCLMFQGIVWIHVVDHIYHPTNCLLVYVYVQCICTNKTNVLTRIFTKLTYKRLIYFCRLSDHYDSSFWKRQPYHMTSYFCNIFCGVFIYMYLSSYCFFLKHRCSYFHVFLYNCSKIITKSVFISAREKKNN